MYGRRKRERALEMLTDRTLSEVARSTGIHRSTLRAWRDAPVERPAECPSCDDAELDPAAYAALLGYYLGDGCISRMRGCFALRVSCDTQYATIVADVQACIVGVRPAATVHLVAAEGATVVQSGWTHWPCLFPQHGPGRKHERTIVLEDWQRAVVEVPWRQSNHQTISVSTRAGVADLDLLIGLKS